MMTEGYVLDFSNKTFAEFFEDEVRVNIDDPKYSVHGTSKANRLRTFLKQSHPHTSASTLRKLWDYLINLREQRGLPKALPEFESQYFKLIAKLEGSSLQPHNDAVDIFEPSETLSELVAAIDRDIQAGHASSALDRLHTYCMKKYAHLLDAWGVSYSRDEPLHSRSGKYVKCLKDAGLLNDTSMQIMKNTTTMFEKFNFVRNNQSLAHDNEILGANEGRFIFESVTSALRFIKSIEKNRFEN